MGIFVSKIPERHPNENGSSLSRLEIRQPTPIAALHKAALKGNWPAAQELFSTNENLIKTAITGGGEIALHIAAVEGHLHFVSELLNRMQTDDVARMNKKGCTALCFAAAAGHVDIARIMLTKHQDLAKIADQGIQPLYMAALQGSGNMARYLYDKSDIGSWTLLDKVDLLTSAIDSELYDLAMRIVTDDKALAGSKDRNGETPLQVLARNSLAFSCDNGQGFWDKIIRNVLPFVKKSKTDDMNANHPAYRLLNCLWIAIESCKEDIEAPHIEAAGANVFDSSKLFFMAAKLANEGLLVELFKKDPNLQYKVNRKKQSIFHIAVLHRYANLFNLIYNFRGTKDLIATYVDNDGNNILHLAGILPPQKQLDSIPGAAWQMQREVMWFKEVEKLVQPSFRHKKNNNKQTPHELFLEEHKTLREKGEKFMKQTAKSCMLVTILIATVVFTTAFTVPGGYDDSGAPVLEKKRMFMTFPVSVAVATLSSLTSMLMFLSILTSGYSDEDFLKALPLWMVVGVSMLFFSIVAMMVALCSCLLFFVHGRVAVVLLSVFFGSVPTLFLVLNYQLLMNILRCTYSRNWLFGSRNRLHS